MAISCGTLGFLVLLDVSLSLSLSYIPNLVVEYVNWRSREAESYSDSSVASIGDSICSIPLYKDLENHHFLPHGQTFEPYSVSLPHFSVFVAGPMAVFRQYVIIIIGVALLVYLYYTHESAKLQNDLMNYLSYLNLGGG